MSRDWETKNKKSKINLTWRFLMFIIYLSTKNLEVERFAVYNKYGNWL